MKPKKFIDFVGKALENKEAESMGKITEALRIFENHGEAFTKKNLDLWEAWDLIYAFNRMGYSLIKTDNLNTYFEARDYAASKGMEFINHHFD